MIAHDIHAGYVRTPNGSIYVQRPADNQWGFELLDDSQSWPGGLGLSFQTWEAADASGVPEDDQERLGWLLED